MRAFWKKDGVVSLKLDDKLYTLSQMVNSSAKMAFFNVFRESDEWTGTDLNAQKLLFCVSVGNVVVQQLGARRISVKEAIPSIGPFPHKFMDPHDNSEGYRLRDEFMWRGAQLVDVGVDLECDAYYAPTIIENLTVKMHRDVIESCEFTNMYGSEDVRDRLLEIHRTGKYVDKFKKQIFPDL